VKCAMKIASFWNVNVKDARVRIIFVVEGFRDMGAFAGMGGGVWYHVNDDS